MLGERDKLDSIDLICSYCLLSKNSLSLYSRLANGYRVPSVGRGRVRRLLSVGRCRGGVTKSWVKVGAGLLKVG